MVLAKSYFFLNSCAISIEITAFIEWPNLSDAENGETQMFTYYVEAPFASGLKLKDGSTIMTCTAVLV